MTVGDLFKERAPCGRLLLWLDGFLAQGVPVRIGDPGRFRLPRPGAAEYAAPGAREVEDAGIKRSAV